MAKPKLGDVNLEEERTTKSSLETLPYSILSGQTLLDETGMSSDRG